MDKTNGKLTVYFEEPFWVGVFERIEDGKLSVAKVIFGAEPKDYEVQEYIQQYYSKSIQSSFPLIVRDDFNIILYLLSTHNHGNI